MKIYSVLSGFVPDSLCVKINTALFQDIFKIVYPSVAPILSRHGGTEDDYPGRGGAALYLRQTRRLQDLGKKINLYHPP